MKLIIVESPNKVKTIQSFLSKDYVVTASVGHVTNIANTGKYQMGIDVDNDFAIKYVISEEKKDVVSKLKQLVKQAEHVIFAADNDREGFAIAKHLKDLLKVPDSKASRVVFNEITKKTVLAALQNPIDFNELYVSAAETRAAEDKMCGYRVSPVLNEFANGKSAGRVQSATLELLCKREREIIDFKPETYYDISLDYIVNNSVYNAKYIGAGKKIDKIKTQETANKVLVDCIPGNYYVKEITSKERNVQAKPPFTTSTFQQECSSKLNMIPAVAMQCAQKLYEGLEIAGQHTGLITYIRTDSGRMDPDFKKSLYDFVKQYYGKDYLGVVKEQKSKSKEQDAHECLRVVDLNMTPDVVNQYLADPKLVNVYKLIYDRTLASAMADSIMTDVSIIINNDKYLFETKGHFVKFDGYKLIYTYADNSDDAESFPDLQQGDLINDKELKCLTKQTQAPKRYTEAALIKEMEDCGIGRPSTYANTITILKDKERNYTMSEGKTLKPTEHGMKVSAFLQENFSNLLSIKSTAEMESKLDDIASGSIDKVETMREYYKNICDDITTLRQTKTSHKDEETGKLCPDCGSKLVYKVSKKGTKFIGCSNYPECKHIEWINKTETENIDIKCPKCGKPLVVRFSKKNNKKFIGCSGYPNCNYLCGYDKLSDLVDKSFMEQNVLDKE